MGSSTAFQGVTFAQPDLLQVQVGDVRKEGQDFAADGHNVLSIKSHVLQLLHPIFAATNSGTSGSGLPPQASLSESR